MSTGVRPAASAILAQRLLGHVAAGTTDHADAILRFDTARYFDADIARAERDSVFARRPLAAAHACELPEPGDFVTRTYLGVPMLIARQDDGSAQAFSNVCRHRGARVESEESGNRRTFSCPYHRWCYRRDGSLRSIPFDDGFDQIDRAEHGLVRLPTDERHGLIWVVPTPGAPLDMREYLGSEFDATIGLTGIGDAVLYRERRWELPMNWKFVLDGVLDTYHFQFLHPHTVGPLFHTNVHAFDAYGPHLRIVMPRKTLGEVGHADPAEVDPAELDIARYSIANHSVFPSTSLVSEPDHFEIWTVLPHLSDPARCQVVLRFLVDELPVDDRQRRFRERNWELLVSAVINEDWPVAQSIADGLGTGHVPHVVYGRNEIAAQHYYRRLDTELRS